MRNTTPALRAASPRPPSRIRHLRRLSGKLISKVFPRLPRTRNGSRLRAPGTASFTIARPRPAPRISSCVARSSSLEHALPVGLADTHAGIRHAQTPAIFLDRGHRQLDLARARIFRRVGQQVERDLLEFQPVGYDLRSARCRTPSEGAALFARIAGSHEITSSSNSSRSATRSSASGLGSPRTTEYSTSSSTRVFMSAA